MDSVLDFMSNDHDKLEKIFEEFRKLKNIDIKEAKHLFHDFKTGLQKHIFWEEEILFPIFEQKIGMYDTGPTSVMRMEHREIEEFLEKIHNKIRGGDTQTDQLENGLLETLAAHNEKEKEDVFTKMKNLPPKKLL